MNRPTFPLPMSVHEADLLRLTEARAGELRVLDEATIALPQALPEQTFADYRHACTRVMKRWIVAEFAKSGRQPLSERTAIVHCEIAARRELKRALSDSESRLIGEAIRDFVTANVLHRALRGEDSRNG